ncbi:MAG: homoserine kinase [Alphaproteobacteria bacterium]|nr:homoserine kinase [Alphaproteobacteria bacterium]MCL2504747.1 homoserine kinase [Alphaproteobacteria bacterium]
MKIRVPATSANLGCGFDSVGFAVNLYLELEILEPSNKWEIIHDLGADIPHDDTNLVISTARKIAPELTPHKIRMTSNIPLERGLGSSSSALVAGIELACAIGGMNLSAQVKLQLACSMEGHPDNVAPAILGGLVISTYSEGNLEYVKADLSNVGLIAYVPDYKLSTVAMRKVLPQELPYKEAVCASSISNVMIASLMSGDFVKAGQMIEQDRFHEKYRAKLVPDLEEVREIARKHGAYAAYLSGAGSTIMCMAPPAKTDELFEALTKKSVSDAEVLKLVLETQGSKRVD